jgi:hypothetical protein
MKRSHSDISHIDPRAVQRPKKEQTDEIPSFSSTDDILTNVFDNVVPAAPTFDRYETTNQLPSHVLLKTILWVWRKLPTVLGKLIVDYAMTSVEQDFQEFFETVADGTIVGRTVFIVDGTGLQFVSLRLPRYKWPLCYQVYKGMKQRRQREMYIHAAEMDSDRRFASMCMACWTSRSLRSEQEFPKVVIDAGATIYLYAYDKGEQIFH